MYVAAQSTHQPGKLYSHGLDVLGGARSVALKTTDVSIDNGG